MSVRIESRASFLLKEIHPKVATLKFETMKIHRKGGCHHG